jgi:hypothetical protein
MTLSGLNVQELYARLVEAASHSESLGLPHGREQKSLSFAPGSLGSCLLKKELLPLCWVGPK